MTQEEKIAMLAEIMDVDEEELAEEKELAEFEEWDSLSKLSLMAEAKKRLGIVLKAEDIRELVTVGDVLALFE